MVVDSFLPHAESGPNGHRKDVLAFSYGFFGDFLFLTHKLFANTHDLFQSDEAGASGKFKYSLLTFIYKLELMSE